MPTTLNALAQDARNERERQNAVPEIVTNPHNLLDEATVVRLWREYRESGSENSRARLVMHYMNGHVRKIATRMHAALPRQVDVEDLIQQGYIGLIEAMERFDIDRDTKFETFSSARIFGAMQDYLRKIDPMPRLKRTRSKKVHAAEETFLKSHGRLPTDEELCDQMGMEPEDFRKMAVDRHTAMTLSYSGRPGDDDQGGESDALSALEDRSRLTPLSHAERSALKEWVVKGLDRRDRLILILYYYEELTMKEVGQALGISESRVSQRLDSIHKCLRSRLCFSGAEGEFEF